jgi:hypothetical protein
VSCRGKAHTIALSWHTCGYSVRATPRRLQPSPWRGHPAASTLTGNPDQLSSLRAAHTLTEHAPLHGHCHGTRAATLSERPRGGCNPRPGEGIRPHPHSQAIPTSSAHSVAIVRRLSRSGHVWPGQQWVRYASGVGGGGGLCLWLLPRGRDRVQRASSLSREISGTRRHHHSTLVSLYNSRHDSAAARRAVDAVEAVEPWRSSFVYSSESASS